MSASANSGVKKKTVVVDQLTAYLIVTFGIPRNHRQMKTFIAIGTFSNRLQQLFAVNLTLTKPRPPQKKSALFNLIPIENITVVEAERPLTIRMIPIYLHITFSEFISFFFYFTYFIFLSFL